ncbi:Ger(x)C family spore germination protein [Bacillus sp. FSL W7-1360]
MNSKWRVLVILVIICVALLAPNTTNVLDELQLMQTIGFDAGDDDDIIGTVGIISYSADKNYQTTTLSAPSDSARHHRIRMDSMTSHPLHAGKLTGILFGADLSERGIFDTLDTYYRDPKVAARAYLAVVDGEAKELLENNYPFQQEEIGYLNRLINHNINRGNLPRTNMHLFMRAFYGKGKDPFLPLLVYTDEYIRIQGLALFKGDKWVDQLNLEQAFFFKLLTDDYETGGFIELPIDENGEQAVLKELRSGKSFTFNIKEQYPSIDIHVRVKARLSEYSGKNLTEERLKEITAYSEKEMTKRLQKLLDDLQKKKLDPIGFGDQVIHRGPMDIKEWEEIYPQMALNATVSVKIIESGVSQ